MGRRGGGIPEGVRRMRLKGWSVESIARLYRIARADVRGMLSCPLPAPPPSPRPPRPTNPARRITGGLALDRTFPPPKPPRERRPRLRKPRRKDPPRWPDWHHSNGEAYRPATGALPAPDVAGDAGRVDAGDVPELAETEASPASSADWGSMHRPRPGALDADDVVRVRYWRSRGIELEDLARWFACSVATIKRALGPDYRPAPAPDRPAPLPPAIAAAEASAMVRWDPADDD